jgi:hypothetical protein
MIIIFLDIDGVLAPHPESCKKPNIDKFGYAFDADCVYWLNKLIKETNAKIVISSSWREMFKTSDDAKLCLENRGVIPNLAINYKTINDPQGYRGWELQQYVNFDFDETHTDKYVILEDEMFDMLYIHRNNIVECDSKVGFGEKEYLQALKILTT